MLRKFLFVGIGGSGGKTIRALKKTLGQRLEQAGWDKGIPAGWQFLQIDTVYDGQDFPAPMLSLNEFCGMVAPGQTYSQIVESLERRFGDAASRQDALAGWLLHESNVPIHSGAGMVRAIGRAISAANTSHMHDALRESASRLQGDDAALGELYTVLTQRKPGKPQQPQAVVLSSIAGGSGAGMLMDVMDALRAADPNQAWLSEPLAFLYTPEVFDSIPESMRSQIPMNAIGAMSELMSARWASGLSASSDALFSVNGVRVPGAAKKPGVGPASTYLIGRKNSEGINLADSTQGSGMNEVFFAVGEAIAGIMTNASISEKFSEIFTTNVFANSGSPAVLVDSSGLTRPGDSTEGMPFGALGFARLSLGMDRMLEYGTHSLVRRQIEKLLFPEFEEQDAMSPVRDAVLIERVVNASYDEFLEGSWLNEHHPSDQIVNVFRGDDRNSPQWNPSPQAAAVSMTGQARRRRAGELAQKCAAQVPGGKAISAAQWESTLLVQFSSLVGDFVRHERSLVEANARQWSKEVQDHLVAHVATWIGRVGLAPTEVMLRRLRTGLEGIANGEIQREGEDMRGKSQGFEPAIKRALGTDSGQLEANAPQVSQALGILQSAAERASEAELLEMMPALLRDVARKLVEPLADACGNALAKLRVDVVGDGGSAPAAAIFRTYPDIREDAAEGVVPSRYIPRQVERLLFDANSFPKEVGSLIRADLPDEDRESWLSLATVLSLEGVPLRSRDKHLEIKRDQSLITVDHPWVPSDGHIRRDSSLGASPIEVTLPASLEDFVERTRTWLSDEGSAFGKLYRMPINSYCNSGSAKEKMDRQKRFANAFTDIIRLSAPLVDMDSSSIVAFHQHSDPALTPTGRQVALTTVPFEENSETGKACLDILTANGLDPSQVRFDGAAAERDVFAFSTVKSGMQPMVFSSLIKPIADSWLSSSINSTSQHGFWNGRRARPLADSIPLPPEIRLSMIVGWFVAIFFQQRTEQVTDTIKGTKIDLWDPQFGWLGFPYPLLPKSPYDEYWLPSVLKSLSLAIIESGVQGNERPLQAYWRLKNLGREVTADPEFGIDMWDGAPLSAMIREWLHDGVMPEQAPIPTQLDEQAAVLGGDRAGALLARVQKNIGLYQNHWAELTAKDSVDPRGWVKTPEIYEIRSDIDQALEILAEYVKRNATKTTIAAMDG
jgi:hypothetical protein